MNKTDILQDELVGAGIGIVKEHRFHPIRKWRFDCAIPEKKIGIEIEGGLWVSGRHNRAAGYIKDMEKYNEAAKLGWKMLRYTPQTSTETIIDDIMELVANCEK